MLEISLFGAFEAKRDGQSLCAHWVRHSHRLLALLTLNHNRAVSTDWILSALLLPGTVLPQSLGALDNRYGFRALFPGRITADKHGDTGGRDW